MPREFHTYQGSHCREHNNFLSLGHANHIDFHALFMLGDLKPDIYILGQASIGVKTTSEHVLNYFTPAVHSSVRRKFSCTLDTSSTLWYHLFECLSIDHSLKSA